MAKYHSTFTPSQSDRETLESLFVARESLAEGLMAAIQESATSGNKHQRLVIGPRGIGKTHLVALLYHRVQADEALAAQLRVAWLPEDPYFIGYAGLLYLILNRLGEHYALPFIEEGLERALDLDETQREQALEQLLLQALGERTLLLITENLDDLLGALKESGQQKLRAFINNHAAVTFLATTTSLVEAITDRKGIFYGFFRKHTLEPFGVGEAATLLARLALRAEDQALADLIWSPLGLARIRAVHYLAGGNPRIYVIFYDFLTRENLDELITPFMKLMDELTPYYQAKMARLAPLQRQIIEVLRRLRRAATVKEIARQAMASSQTISAQLGKLKELGYVLLVESLGRSSYYELREPLMRLCLEVKEQQGRTVELFVQFLRVWYSQGELEQLAHQAVPLLLERDYLCEAAERAATEADPLMPALEKEFFQHQSAGELEQALQTAETAIARAPEEKRFWKNKVWCLEALKRPLEERLACWQRVAEIDPEDFYPWHRKS